MDVLLQQGQGSHAAMVRDFIIRNDGNVNQRESLAIGGRAEGLNALLKSCGWEAVSNEDHWKLVTISDG